jgi:hypothetical protein
MKKFKLLFTTAALILGTGQVWADDVFKDITNTYITNADFEGEYTVYSNPSSDRAIYQPTGWTVSYTTGDPNDMTALNSSCLQWSNFSGKAKLSTGGNNTYWVRMRWGTGAVLELSQTFTLPAGKYKLTAAYYKNGSGGDGYILVNSTTKNTNVNEDVWKSLTIDFTSDGIATTKIGCKATHTNTYEKFLAFDNFVLEWNLTYALTTLITSATEVYNEDTSNISLKNAIDAADAVKDSQDSNVLEEAYNNLQSVAALAINRKSWKTAKDAAEAAIANNDYENVTGAEKTTLETEIAKTEPSTAEGYETAANALITATSAFTAAKDSYDAYVAAKADAEGVSEADVLAVVIAGNVAATAADALAASIILQKAFDIKAATTMAPVVTNFVVNGTFTDNVNGWTCTGGFQNQARASNQNGAFTVPFFENWHPSAKVNKMYQTISNIPNGTYRLDIAAFVNTLADPNESQYVFANSDKVYLTTGDPTAYEVYTVVTNNQVEIGLEQTTATANWMGIDNVSLRYYGAGDVINDAKNAAHKLAWLEAKAAAEAAVADEAYTNVTGSEKTALEAEIAKAEPTTAEGYDAAAADLTTATAAFTAAKASYDAYAEAKGIATTLAATSVTAPTTAAEAVTRAQELYVNIDTKVKTDFGNDVTTVYAGEFSGSFSSTTTGQHWSGDGSKSYLDNWGSGIISTSQTVTLPAGSYVLKTAGRGAADAVSHKLYMSANETTVNFPNNGDTGKGIATDGAVNYGEGTYANNNVGRGWEWRFIPVTLTEETNVTVTLTMERSGGNTWGSFCDFTILCDDATYAPIALDAAKAELQAAIDAAPAVATANIGDGVFQYAEAGVTAYSEAKTAAQAAHDAVEATLESIANAKSTFETAIETYNALEINAPANGKLFNVILTYSGYQYDQKAVTYMAGDREDMGKYNIKYNAPANQNLAQAFTFTKVSGNNYKMSQIDADGNVRYVSTGIPHGGNTSQIRTTTEADDALEVTIIPTNTEGVWNLYNTEANNYIGSQDAGFFTVNSHIDFNIVETTKPNIEINTTEAGWGTVMLPFAQALPANVKAYTCAAVDGKMLTLVEVESLEANKPYIIEGAWEATVTGNAQGIKLTYDEGLFTGTYEDIDAPDGKYILQKHDEKVGLYEVNYESLGEMAKPKVRANHAYMNAPATEAHLAAYFFTEDGEATAINAIAAMMNGKAQIFDANGKQLNRLQKGLNIIRMDNGSTQKIMVK